MTSNDALVKLSGKVQWVHSYIAADRTFCVYLAESAEAALKELVWANLWFFTAALAESKAPIRCPITGYPCEGDLSHLCEDYGCARKGGLSPCSDENL